MNNNRTYLTFAVALLMPSAFVSAQDAPPTVSQFDRLKIAVQKICPVTGQPLESMGPPLRVKLGDEEVFLCCKACVTKKVSREHWATIHANFREAQGKCPVMGKDLPAGARWTVVNGQIFYTCCPPCIDKIKANPKTYLAKLDQLYTSKLAEPQGYEAIKIAVQRICPVTGKPLGSMGTSIKVKIGEEELFLCCEACRTKQVDRKHWATIHTSFAKAQSICPVMKKPIPANAKWTIVNGQIVYVCCPPCIGKITTDPAKFIADVDRLYSASLNGSSPLE